MRASQLNMKQTSYKAPWWKTAVASLGILSTVVAGGPPNSFAADTVKVSNRRRRYIAQASDMLDLTIFVDETSGG